MTGETPDIYIGEEAGIRVRQSVVCVPSPAGASCPPHQI
jgi:hypothetical protein